MSTIRNLRQWSETHHPSWFVILRIGLGLILMSKGINFMRDSTLLDSLIYGPHSLAENNVHWLTIFITWINLLGGLLILLGLMTRLMAFIQLPILIGAIIIINVRRGGFASGYELWLAILAFLLTLLFFVEGSGPISLDTYFSRNKGQSQGTNLPG
jgi:putative oxidoreductase